MTDNIITRNEAIDRMKAGLPVEYAPHADYHAWMNLADWSIFNLEHWVFRKPHEPRREAQSWDGVVYLGFVGRQPVEIRAPGVTLREVLPGDVVLQKMTVHEALVEYENWRANYPDAGKGAVWLASRRAAGLVAEKKEGGT